MSTGFMKFGKRKFHVILKIGDDERKAQVPSNTTQRPEWNEQFYLASVVGAQTPTGTAGLAPSKAYTELVDSASGVSQVELLDALYPDVLSRLLPTNKVKATTRSPYVLAMALVKPFNMDSLAAMHAAPYTRRPTERSPS
ncbi:hypothetical protein PHLCEN_2v5644 [Hermanssonia centrifuga]|uniref:C2 domain-containing protein n=1 Tax=Hermanssonia centrifuga TaxID=98765 RepID=A0A2R6P1R3_9APHY|nr:hypothetical protein PHLCEN_2v5644 [Hermanssonia centrifuga]